jgi:cellulose synthase/poly-beta-1,6-N-acetylglucosamine synthase-like glycosyltransferase
VAATIIEKKKERCTSRESICFPFVSIIIPVYNAELSLGACLDSISALDYPADKREVIVVDNGSTDRSRIIAKRYGVRLLSEVSIKSSYAARNKGVLAAEGELIAFTDADCVVTPAWLRHLSKEWEDRSVGCVAGEIDSYQPKTLVEKFSQRAGILKQKNALTCLYLPYASTANAAYRKGIFDKIGLFIPEMFTGGDAEIAWRMQQKLGLKIKFIPEALVYHKHRSSVIGLYRQFKKYEYGKLFLHKYYPEYHLPTIEERKRELDKAIRLARLTFRDNTKKFYKKEMDFVDLAAPFLRIVLRYATYKARVEKRK